jgi:hypothetical protein
MQEIRADGGSRVYAEQQYEDRRHERSTPYSGEADNNCNHESGERLG